MQVSKCNKTALTKALLFLLARENKLLVGILCLILILSFSISTSAQQSNDSLYTKNTVKGLKLDTAATNHSPKVAGWMSAAIPGLGQVYNKKYWKAPVIYVAFGTITYFLVSNNTEYQKYREAYILRTDDDNTNDDILPKYTVENLRVLKNLYWKKRDFDVILLAVVYVLNILDAVVDAHFYTYDISEDLSLHINPVVSPVIGFGSSTSTMAGLSLSLSF
jgi:hypothetical protein